jgi:Uncharacterized protein related to glutamine synthetase
MKQVPETFGSLVFNQTVMKERLPKDIYKSLEKTMAEGTPLEESVANVVANAMKDWAISLGATHFTHWFQPMTGITAEKHDSFIEPAADGGIIMKFSGKALIKGEPDASSFPSGGLRATFEARGYTAWDPSSYAFIKDNTLCIPTAFCSYTGEALDKKTPLLRSMEALNTQTLRVLNLFGVTDAKHIVANVGSEQEYFLIDKEIYAKRPDLIYTGRTLFGARPPKGQELDDHYFGVIKQRVSSYMRDLDNELWKLGILAKTEHNEVAPAQHELAPIYSSANIATDHNQLTMEMMKSIAKRHGMECLLHEKPFAGINGSGKHNNWSLSTDTGVNLLDPGKTPRENAQFLLFLIAVIQAVDEYQDLLRVSVASASNDHRLGANEAPPAIVSIFLGDELTAVLESITTGNAYAGNGKTVMEIGASVLPKFPKDTTDRNRTSPFAFTGNKFEFRMPGSAQSIAGPNFVINTIVADVLSRYADALENSKDFVKDVAELIKTQIKAHERIIFNGNGYDDAWVKQAEANGLSNLRTTPEAFTTFINEKSIDVFTKQGVLTKDEIISRYEISLESYSKAINIEALTAIDITYHYIIPSVLKNKQKLLKLVKDNKDIGVPNSLEMDILNRISTRAEEVSVKLKTLEYALADTAVITETQKQANAYCEKVLTAMEDLRATVDDIELIADKSCWALPSYGDLLYSVK